jgi:hypothetical protein
LTFGTVDELDAATDAIELSAIEYACAFEVDLWIGDMHAGDPLLIQFLVGYPGRSTLVWHDDGEAHYAIDRTIPESGLDIRCERIDGSHEVEAPVTGMTLRQVREALAVYLLTGSRPTGLEWIEAEMD